MNPRLAHLLVRLYPRSWRQRYGAEFEELLRTSPRGLRASAEVLRSALRECLAPTFTQAETASTSALGLCCRRAPWVPFGLAPLLLLAAAYAFACFILWSGWHLFLPGTDTPFVPLRLGGLGIFYFGAGRLLYYSAPVLTGWGVLALAARQHSKATWPTFALILLACIGATAQVHATRAFHGGPAHVSMDLALFSLAETASGILLGTAVRLSLMALPYLLWRSLGRRSGAWLKP
jgi:hypothetical protein